MPAELLLLLIVAFANPSCQVLSSLRMGEAPAPHLLRNSPSRELRHSNTKVLCLPAYPSLRPRSPDTLLSSLRSRNLDPSYLYLPSV